MSTAPLRVYHNPRCSKSRSACALIAENGIAAEVVECRKKGARLTLTIHSPASALRVFGTCQFFTREGELTIF